MCPKSVPIFLILLLMAAAFVTSRARRQQPVVVAPPLPSALRLPATPAGPAGSDPEWEYGTTTWRQRLTAPARESDPGWLAYLSEEAGITIMHPRDWSPKISRAADATSITFAQALTHATLTLSFSRSAAPLGLPQAGQNTASIVIGRHPWTLADPDRQENDGATLFLYTEHAALLYLFTESTYSQNSRSVAAKMIRSARFTR
jgi:hypothetical protein